MPSKDKFLSNLSELAAESFFDFCKNASGLASLE